MYYYIFNLDKSRFSSISAKFSIFLQSNTDLMGISIMVVQYALTVLEMDRNHHAQLCLGNNLFLDFAEVLFVGRQVYKTEI